MNTAQKQLIILARMTTFRRTLPARTMATFLVLAATAAATLPVQAQDGDPEDKALRSLVDAELAFARMGLEQGIRAAFIANFAKDGIVSVSYTHLTLPTTERV